MATVSPLPGSRAGKGRWERGGSKDVGPPTERPMSTHTGNAGPAPGTRTRLPLGNMKPATYSFRGLMLFHPQRRRPVITCHTSNGSPLARELR